MKLNKLLIAALLAMCVMGFSMSPVNAGALIDVHVYDNHWASSSVVVWDSTNNNIYYSKRWAPGAAGKYNHCFRLPDTTKFHNIIVKFNHGIAGQGSSDEVTIPKVTDGEVDIDFETYGDDVNAEYKGVKSHWNDKHRNIFWLGQP